MSVYVGLDVSLNSISICVVNAAGDLVWRGKSLSEPASLLAALEPHRSEIRLTGIEACPLSEWLYGALADAGVPIVCIETRHAQRFLSSRPNKTDRSDARGIAEMMRLGHFRPVHVKSRVSQILRTTLRARHKFVEQLQSIELTIRGLLKVHGLKIGAVHRCTFAARVEALLNDDATRLHFAAAGDILHLERGYIARAELAIDREVEEGEIPHVLLQLQAGADRPDLLHLQRRLLASQFSAGNVTLAPSRSNGPPRDHFQGHIREPSAHPPAPC